MESHRASIQNMLQWTKEDAALLAMTNEVDYDQDGEKSEEKKVLKKFREINFCPFFSCSLLSTIRRHDHRKN